MSETNDKFEWLIKVLVIGDSGVGKTNILLRTCDNKFLSHNLSTIGKTLIYLSNKIFYAGVDFKTKILEIENKKIKLQIWDTAGQERFQTIALSYYKGAWGIILVFSIDNKKSFENIGKWMKQIKDNAPSDVNVLLVGNKCDLLEKRQVTYEEAQALADSYKIQFYETSAKNNINIEEIFEKLAFEIKNKIGDSLDVMGSRSIYISDVIENKDENLGCTC